jgi:hypothetical protein
LIASPFSGPDRNIRFRSVVELGMTIHDHEVNLRLRFGADAARTIVVPVDVRKGSYPQRYELYVDDVHVGWVVKIHGAWEGYLVAEQNYGTQQHVASHKTRTDALDQLLWYLGKSARGNVLADRAEAAYAEAAS